MIKLQKKYSYLHIVILIFIYTTVFFTTTTKINSEEFLNKQITKKLLHEIKIKKFTNQFYDINKKTTIKSLQSTLFFVSKKENSKNNNLNKKYSENNFKKIVKISLKEQNELSSLIQNQLKINHNLLSDLIKQKNYTNTIILQKKNVELNIIQVHLFYTDLIKKIIWLEKSPVLKKILRSQISKLPNNSQIKIQQLDNKMAQIQTKRLQYENQIKNISTTTISKNQKNNDFTEPLKNINKKFLDSQLTIQKKLLNLLLNNCDTQILELTKLKISYEKLKNSLKKIQKIKHRYLFWVADTYPITLSYLSNIIQDLRKLTTKNIFFQIKSSLIIIFTKSTTIIPILFSLILIGLNFKIHNYYKIFLEKSSKKIGKINQDNFLLTFYNICYSILISTPIPIFLAVIGYNINHSAWMYPIAATIGNSIYITAPILLILIINAYFALPEGLFSIHFGWSYKKLKQIFSHYYKLTVIFIILLLIMLITFNNYHNHEFAPTLGRLCFILLCFFLTFVTKNLKSSGLPLHLNKKSTSKNIINTILWNLMIFSPIVAIIFCSLGYLSTSQKILAHLEASLFIWMFLLMIYHIIRRWMSIQRKYIIFERTKKNKNQRKFTNFSNENKKFNLSYIENNTKTKSNKIEKKNIDLKTISAQSLQLIRSILTLIFLLSITFLWAELHSAFSFLEKITLWDVTSTIKGVNNIQPITLNSVLIAILVFIITTKTVRNFPALLKLILLQHLELTPGTKYAITTLTKYALMLIGSLIGLSILGIEWVKIQWLIAALGVGLGFGLQEIFANFISGLIILVEKPIRIGDTVTIQNLTGKVTKINTRATTITDWDHKEIIVPNKEFITKKFINWSLSDTITRVVLKVPAPPKQNIKKIIYVLFEAIKDSSLVLTSPAPEVYLIDIQQGLPIFELRLYAENTNLRIPMRHQVHLNIIKYYQNNKLELPFLPFYIYKNHINTNENFNSIFTNSTN